MSLAGIRSNRGDTYQRSVALYWIVEMLMNEKIVGIQVDAVALPDENYLVYGDDIIILFADGNKHFIQAKVNQADHQYWRLADPVLKKELIAAREQLLADPVCKFYFYSRTPFDTLQRVIEEANLYPNYQVFLRKAGQKQKDALEKLAMLWELDQEVALNLVKRIGIGDHHSSSEWQKYSLSRLESKFSRPQTALELIYNYVDRQHSKLGDPQFVIDRKDILDMLATHGIYHAYSFDQHKLIEAFQTFSLQGRQWPRKIGEAKIIRSELEELKLAIQEGVASILLEDIAGGGKTCILLDLMDYLDNQENIATLFIKGDLFASIESLSDLVTDGLPSDFIAQSAHLAENRRLVIIIDSLDVLAVGRSHKSLQCFLGLISNLSTVPNITLIAASRSFDAKYDPLLREATWAKTITVKSLSFEEDISPLLVNWDINPEEVNAELQALLIIPQNLKLFHALIRKGMLLSDIAEHDLYDLYIQELIERDQHLGSEVVDALQNIAVNLLKQRSYKFPKNQVALNSQQLQRLLSQEVLAEVGPNQLMFSHQTLADALRIRQAQKSGRTLQTFVCSQPQLPFVRPAIRLFILYLRSALPDQFIKQLRQFLLSDGVSMHLKRLAIETLAEMSPKDDDLPIISMLSTKLPDLFSRFLDRANNEGWFSLLYNQWLPAVNISVVKNSLDHVLRYFVRFIDSHEKQLISVWNRAFDEQWLPVDNLVRSISMDLRKLKKWDVPEVKQLLEKLLNADNTERDDIGRAICQYIEATGEGDELLWKFIIRDAKPISEIYSGRELKLNCQKHDLLDDDFLERRLKSSDVLFGNAIEYLLQSSESFTPGDAPNSLKSNLLDVTSFNMRHSNCDSLPHDSIHEFLMAVESAMKFRAENNDPCWKVYESRLRKSNELGIRYLLCETYLSNIIDHLEGIEHQLNDRGLLQQGYLEYELGILAAKAYPYISEEVQENYQKLIMGLYEDFDDEWVEEKVYNYLQCVPAMFRLPELYGLFEKCRNKYGQMPVNPSILMSGGRVLSPVPEPKLIELSHENLIRLFYHYNDYHRWSDRPSGSLIGGRESLEGELRAAASLEPMHFFPLISMINKYGLSVSYIHSIIDGLANHLRCRFTDRHSSNWKAVEPLPDGGKLANIVLGLVERYCIDSDNGYTHSRAIQACAAVLEDDQSLERICFQLWRLGLHNDPKPKKDDDENSLINSGINSVRGIAAETVLRVCNKRLEEGKKITTELRELLIRYAKDPSMVVRVTLLYRFPYFHSQEPEFGWKLIRVLVKNAKPRLIKHLERTLYYQYHAHFDRVKPYLDIFKAINDEKTAAAWGRLAALSFLSGHINEEDLWCDLNDRHQATREGFGQVFVANLNNSKTSSACIEGLARLMKADAPKSVFTEFERSLDKEDQLKFVPLSLINRFVEYAPVEYVREIDGVFNWLEKQVITNPDDVLQVLEKLVDRLSDLSGSIYFHRPDTLLTTLKYLLREADLSDDEEFINRVLFIQDWFLSHRVNELETLLEAAG